MYTPSADLHGNAPDKCPVALLLIDVINDFEFEGGELLLAQALPMARRLAELRKRAGQARVPVIYANDNFGKWRSDFRAQVEHCLHDNVRGKTIVELLRPDEQDYFVLKPKHSGFYSTGLNLLLQSLGVQTVVVTGLATNICVLFTANDAYMRNFRVVVPKDCCAANQQRDHEHAIELMAQVLKADIRPAAELSLEHLLSEHQTNETLHQPRTLNG